MKIEIEINDAYLPFIQEVLDSSQGEEEMTSHGALDIKSLAEMLMEDVMLAVKRPGSWEGANMLEVLSSHGYQLY